MKHKSSVVLYFDRPDKIVDNHPELPSSDSKDYTYYTTPLSSAIDAGLRLALAGYGIRIVIDGHVVIKWDRGYIESLYYY